MTQSGVAVVTSKQTNICWEAMLGMKQSKCFVLAFGNLTILLQGNTGMWQDAGVLGHVQA